MLAWGSQTTAEGHLGRQPQPALHRACGQEPSQPRGRCPCLAPRGAVFTQEAFSEVDTKHFPLSHSCRGAQLAQHRTQRSVLDTVTPPRAPPGKLLTSCARRAGGPTPRSPVPAPDAAAAGRAGGRTGAAPPSPASGLGQDSAGNGMRNYWLSKARRPQGAEEESWTCPQAP